MTSTEPTATFESRPRLSTLSDLGSVPLAGSWGAIYAVAFGLAAAHGLTQPSVASLISRAARADMQGGALGTSQSAASLARVVGPAMAGALFQQLAPSAPYFVAAVLALGAAACVRLRPAEA